MHDEMVDFPKFGHKYGLGHADVLVMRNTAWDLCNTFLENNTASTNIDARPCAQSVSIMLHLNR